MLLKYKNMKTIKNKMSLDKEISKLQTIISNANSKIAELLAVKYTTSNDLSISELTDMFNLANINSGISINITANPVKQEYEKLSFKARIVNLLKKFRK